MLLCISVRFIFVCLYFMNLFHVSTFDVICDDDEINDDN